MEGDSLAPYVATEGGLLDAALAFAELTPEDVVCDLGSGDGRLPIWAVVRGAKGGVGVEVDGALVAKAKENAQARRVAERVRILRGDLSDPDAEVLDAIDGATLVTAYLLPEGLAQISPLLSRHLAKPGARLLTLGWPPPKDAFRPTKVSTLGESTGAGTDAYLFLSQSLS